MNIKTRIGNFEGEFVYDILSAIDNKTCRFSDPILTKFNDFIL